LYDAQHLRLGMCMPRVITYSGKTHLSMRPTSHPGRRTVLGTGLPSKQEIDMGLAG